MPSKRKPTGVRAEGLPAASTVVKAERKKQLISTPMSMEEKLKCLELYGELKDVAMVALKMNRAEVSVRKFLARYQSTTTGARMVLEAGAERLATRIVKDANVDQALEVMDRLDILSAKRDSAGPSTSFNLIIGMPTSGAKTANSVPVPSQKQIEEAAVDAEVVKTEAADGTNPG